MHDKETQHEASAPLTKGWKKNSVLIDGERDDEHDSADGSQEWYDVDIFSGNSAVSARSEYGDKYDQNKTLNAVFEKADDRSMAQRSLQ